MLRHAPFATWFVSAYLAVYTILLTLGPGLLRQVAFGMFLASPIFVGWLVYTVIRHGHPPLRDLAENEEYGYQDRPHPGP